MCVLIYKPQGVALPSKKILKACSIANPHGCGFATANDYFRSMNFETFYKRLQNVKKDENCIIHFRFATHGSVRIANVHPFAHKGVYFAHNGILTNIVPYKDRTDSQTAFMRYIYPAIEKYGFCSAKTDSIINSVRGISRFAVMYDDKVKLYGDFVTLAGVKYSNTRFMSYVR